MLKCLKLIQSNQPVTSRIRVGVSLVLGLLSGLNALAQPTNLTPSAKPLATSLSTVVDKKNLGETGFLSAEWSFGLQGQSFSNEKEQAQVAGLALGGKVRYGLLPSLEVKLDAAANLQTGYAQSRFGENVPKNGPELHEAVIQYKPIPRFTLQAGAINQAHLSSPLIVSAQAFPATLERILLGSKLFNVEIKAQQAVPTSSTLSTKSLDAEQMPTFMTEGLTIRTKFAQRVALSVFAFHYAFNDLPSVVASDSELYGNTVTEVTAKRSQFTYGFDGFSYGGGAKVLMARETVWMIDGQIVRNASAPASYNQAYLATTGFEFGLRGDVDLKPKAEYFFAESDVTPGYYNGSDRGHNNRRGWAADVSATFKKAGFTIGGRYVMSELINASLNQTRQSFILLRFESLHALL